MSFFSALGLLLIALKLMGHTDLPWALVIAPIVLPYCFAFVVLVLNAMFTPSTKTMKPGDR